MSAPDIGALLGLVEAHRKARKAADVALDVALDAIEAATVEILAKEFGPVEVDPERRSWGSIYLWLSLEFRFHYGDWAAVVEYGARHRTYADSPRAAVDQALAALAKTHPAEADALAAVIPKEPTS